MSWNSICERWNEFFYKPQPTFQISLFRILYGACVLSTLFLLRDDWLNWFGQYGWISSDAMQVLEPGPRINLFTLLPPDDVWITGFFWFFVASAFFLTIGLWTRISSVVTFVCLTSLHQRNLMITHGGDTFLRVTGFFLIFAPAGSMFSIDALWKRWRKASDSAVPAAAPWAQRMIQGELSLLYLTSFLWKLRGHAWLDGSALFYVTHLIDLQRFPIPRELTQPIVVRIATWFVLSLELALALGMWWKPTRKLTLGLGLAFHLTLEYVLNIPMFQWDVLIAYVLFLDPVVTKRLLDHSTSHESYDNTVREANRTATEIPLKGAAAMNM